MKKHCWMMGFGLAALLLGAGAALAEPAAVKGDLDERIDMALKKASPDDLFKTFAQMLGAEAVVDPAVRGPVSVELHNVRARTLLDAICESIGCRWSLEPGNPPKLRVTSAPAAGSTDGSAAKPSKLRDPIDLRVTRADGRDVLKTFGEILSADAEIDPGLKGEVTLNLENSPVGESLDAVCQSLGCEWRYTEAANGRRAVLRVVPRSNRK